jgi:hypothetical protein
MVSGSTTDKNGDVMAIDRAPAAIFESSKKTYF